MRFYVIYSFDTTKDVSIKPFQPPDVRKWDNTEGDELYEYDYLGPSFKNGKHRKYCREMSKKEFKKFVEHCGLVYEDVQTMGSLTELGWLPAFSFSADSGMQYYELSGLIYGNAYVTPFPEPVKDPARRFAAILDGTYPQNSFWPLSKAEIETLWAKKEEKYWGWLGSAMKRVFG